MDEFLIVTRPSCRVFAALQRVIAVPISELGSHVEECVIEDGCSVEACVLRNGVLVSIEVAGIYYFLKGYCSRPPSGATMLMRKDSVAHGSHRSESQDSCAFLASASAHISPVLYVGVAAVVTRGCCNSAHGLIQIFPKGRET